MKYLSCKIGGITIGHGYPIAVQSMCNTDTLDIAASVSQCEALSRAGCDIIRLTTQGVRQVDALAQIKAQLRAKGIETPLVADIHFNADVALAAARVAEKVRINPGNFSRDFDIARAKFAALTDLCRQTGCAIRIGLNHGSLGERITAAYGDTPLGMARAAMEWLQMAAERDFTNITVSLKSSNTKVMADAYRMLYRMMAEELGMVFPVHVGVTEAGAGDTGRIKSVVGIGTLLREGIGDTIRVSLTEDPVNEIPVAKALRTLAASPAPEPGQTSFIIDATDHDDFIIKAAYMAGPDLLDHRTDDFQMHATVAASELDAAQIDAFKDDLMQACRRRFTKPEYIACPGCGRTLYDIQSLLKKIMDATGQFAGVKIAVMGCIVNCPGEMADADYGYVGEGGGKVTLYKAGEPVLRGIPQEEGVEKLVALINGTLKV